jgi:HAD superfamily hydrolase (TIGR01458 family)
MITHALRAVLLDLDGVLYVEDDAVPGAADAIERLRRTGVGVRFMTNTTTRSRAATLSHLDDLGFAVDDEELVTPAVLALQLCRARGHRRVALFVADETDFDGLAVVHGDLGADAVILGDLGDRWTYAALNRAFRVVMTGADLIALQKNRFWQRGGELALDAGPFVAALEYATGRDATVVGKPSPDFFAEVLRGLGVEAEEAVMVGDDVETDIGGAMAAGVAGVLVRTGKYREHLVRASHVEPTATVDSITDVPALIAGLVGA